MTTYEHSVQARQSKGYVIKRSSAYNTTKSKFGKKPKGKKGQQQANANIVMSKHQYIVDGIVDGENSSVDEATNIKKLQNWYKEQSSPQRMINSIDYSQMLQHYHNHMNMPEEQQKYLMQIQNQSTGEQTTEGGSVLPSNMSKQNYGSG